MSRSFRFALRACRAAHSKPEAEATAAPAELKARVQSAPMRETGNHVVIVDGSGKFHTQLVAQQPTASGTSAWQTVVVVFAGWMPATETCACGSTIAAVGGGPATQ